MEIVAADDCGRYWLARTFEGHGRYSKQVVVFRNRQGVPHGIAVVEKPEVLPDEPSEFIVSNGRDECIVTTENHQGHIATIGSAFYVDARRRRCTCIETGPRDKPTYFNADAYWTRYGFVGICSNIYLTGTGKPLVEEYRYLINRGKLQVKQQILGDVLAYSADRDGNEETILQRKVGVFLIRGSVASKQSPSK